MKTGYPIASRQKKYRQMINNYIYIPKKNRRERVLLDDILYLKAAGSFTEIYVEGSNKRIVKFVPCANLKNISKQISNPNFLRVHRSFLINRNKVEAIDGRRLVIAGTLIPFSEQHKKLIASEFPVLKT